MELVLQRNHEETDHGLKQVSHGKVIANVMAGDLCISCGSHQKTTTGDGGHPHKRIIHSWTQLTLLVNIMARTPLTQSNLSVSSAVVNLLFSSTSKRGPRIFRYIVQREKPVHLSGLTARRIGDKNADMDYHAVLPREYQAGGASMREELCQQDPKQFTITATGASMNLRATGSDWSSIKFRVTESHERSV